MIRSRSYIGATDEGQEGNWVWLDGSQFQFRNWKRGEPNNVHQLDMDENCAVLKIGGFWNDVICNRHIAGYICSYKMQGT